MTVLAPTFGITLLLLTPFLLAKLISYAIDNSRTKVDTSLVEDLAYIRTAGGVGEGSLLHTAVVHRKQHKPLSKVHTIIQIIRDNKNRGHPRS